MNHVARILDANANRAREAMRVMEEASRFLLDDASLSEIIKSLRHDFATAIATLPIDLSLHRDTPNDVGTQITLDSETSRTNVNDVVIAAGKRLSEALRAMEEYAKTLPKCPAPALLEQLRYRGYNIEKQLASRLLPTLSRQWKLCILISEHLCKDGNWQAVAQAVIAGGADCIQLREKTLDASELLRRACWLVQTAQPAGVSVIINDRPDIAMLAGAHGVHLGQSDLPCPQVRKLVGHQLLIGVSTSNLADAQQAYEDGANYCGVGPMFPTTTKHKPLIVGPAYLKTYRQWDKLPHLAIGGIDTTCLPQLIEAGVQGIAVSSVVCGSENPQQVVEQLLER
ncbi:MAG: thiamine phosphate synthase [Phycisphaeraceae bacterium]|nr:thiamine phosphate synthase [Phycisphaeraceae bacterium]